MFQRVPRSIWVQQHEEEVQVFLCWDGVLVAAGVAVAVEGVPGLGGGLGGNALVVFLLAQGNWDRKADDNRAR